ncbi:MAG: VOC family protein [Fimbriimonas sp.]
MTNVPEAKPTTLTPHLSIRNAVEALEFYEKAFGAQILCALKSPDGKLMHGAVSIDGATFYVVDEYPEMGGTSPQALGGSPVTLHLQVADCDAVYNRAVEAGCTSVMPLELMFWGDRWGLITDPYGHSWSVATTVNPMSFEDLQKAAENMSCGVPEPA